MSVWSGDLSEHVNIKGTDFECHLLSKFFLRPSVFRPRWTFLGYVYVMYKFKTMLSRPKALKIIRIDYLSHYVFLFLCIFWVFHSWRYSQPQLAQNIEVLHCTKFIDLEFLNIGPTDIFLDFQISQVTQPLYSNKNERRSTKKYVSRTLPWHKICERTSRDLSIEKNFKYDSCRKFHWWV